MSADPRVEAVLAAAAAIGDSRERGAYLDQACAGDAGLRREVESLLAAHDEAGAFLHQPAAGAPLAVPPSGGSDAEPAQAGTPNALAEKEGDHIGRYKLLEHIGTGGFGDVWMAEQEEPVRRRVALKIIKLGMDTKEVIARFEAERQALALMDHPNIAKVHDGGATETGRPYFVMELVRGIRITDYCDQHRLSTSQRLDLFVHVCRAVQHAHQKGIIHRDLKPSNVLVTVNDGVPVPKVIDFGIAKATSQHLTDKTLFTRFAQFLGTPAYMSPEQAELTSLDIDTRSDIYSLGVLLYELLTGHTPLDNKLLLAAGLDEMRRVIREKEPPRPSTCLSTLRQADLTATAQRRQTDPPKLIATLRGDLDWIVMKCLEKDRTRRYDTANGLAMDIHRYISHQPVLARPPSTIYGVQKFIRRNKGPVAAATALALVLVLGALVSAWQWRMAVEARRGEEQHRQRAEAKVVAEAEARAEATEQRNIALQQRRRAEEVLERMELQRAQDYFDFGKPSVGLTYLAGVLRENPSNRVAAERLLSALTYHSSALLAFPPILHRQRISSYGQFSPDGLALVAASPDKTARIWSAQTGQPLSEPLRHEAWIRSARFSPDGQRVVTASDDKTARIWDARTGQPLTEPLRHSGSVTSAEFSPDGLRVVTTSYDRTARIWDARTGQQLGQPLRHAAQVNSAQFSPDGLKVVTVSQGNSVRMWDVQTGEPFGAPLRHGKPVRSAQFSPDGGWVVTASNDETARVWDAHTGQPVTGPLRHHGPVTLAQFSPDGRRVVTASGDRTARIWDAQTGQPLAGPLRHDHYVTSAQFSPDGLRVVTASNDKTARVWNTETGELLAELIHNHPVSSAQFGPDGWRVITHSDRLTARVWDTRTARLHSEPLRHQNRVTAAEFSPDGSRVLTGSFDGTARLWDARTGEPLTEPLEHDGWVRSARLFGPDGTRVLMASGNLAWIRNARTGQDLVPPLVHNGKVLYAQFSLKGRWVVTAANGPRDLLDELRVWDGLSGRPLNEPIRARLVLLGTDSWSSILDFSPDGLCLACALADGTARIWMVRTGQPLTEPLRHQAPVTCLQFSSDGRWLATGSADTTARIWDVRSGQPLIDPLRHRGAVNSVQFSLDGRRLVTTSDDTTARIWDSQTGQPLTAPLHHDGTVNFAEFSPDGLRLATASRDETARVWDVQTGQPLIQPFKHEARLYTARFSPDGHRLVTSSADGTARIWEVPMAELPIPNWLLDLAETMAGQRVNQEGIFETVSIDQLWPIRDRLRDLPATEPYAQWATWFFADPGQRTIAPFSTLTVRQYIQRLMEANTRQGSIEAARLSPTNGLVLARLARQVLTQDSAENPRREAEADFLSRRALALAPNDAEVVNIRAQIEERLRDNLKP